jgi:S1-C subfamily serine protease
MNAASKSVVVGSVFAGLIGVTALAATTSAQAAPPHVELRLSSGAAPRLRLSPGPGTSPHLVPAPAPRTLGFYGHFEWGYGMVVDSVPWGTPARRMGLESGDVIVAINGQWLRSQGDYYRALAYGGDHARITVQDVRTGLLATRVAHLHEGGPVAYGSSPGVSLELH